MECEIGVLAMSGLRFTIAQLMALVLVAGVGFAALRAANEFWASTTFTIALLSISAASVSAFVSKGKARAAWAGYAIAGWACLVTWMVSSATAGFAFGPPELLLYWALIRFQPAIQPMVAGGGDPMLAYHQTSHSIEVIVLGIAGAGLGRFLAPKVDRPRP
jgi:hypothetical protein